MPARVHFVAIHLDRKVWWIYHFPLGKLEIRDTDKEANSKEIRFLAKAQRSPR
jgi:hypothetical protein